MTDAAQASSGRYDPDLLDGVGDSSDVLFWLYPMSDAASDACRARVNARLYTPYVRDVDSKDSRQRGGFIFRFKDLPDGAQGFIFGSNPNTCDVQLTQSLGDGKQKFRLDVKWETGQIFFHDLGTRSGTLLNLAELDGEILRFQGNGMVLCSGDVITRSALIFKILMPSRQKCWEKFELYLHYYKSLNTQSFAEVSYLEKRMELSTPDKDASPNLLRQQCKVGGGAVSTVYQAVDYTGSLYAVKVACRQAEPDVDRKRHVCESSIIEERKLLQNLSNEYIVKVFPEKYLLKADANLVMEFVRYGDIYHNNQWSASEMTGIIKQILKGLIFLHETAKVVHRDIKPTNILLVSRHPTDLKVKICDFHIATRTGTLKANDQVSTVIAAPEFWDPKNFTFTDKGDIYALGVMLLSSSIFGGLDYTWPNPFTMFPHPTFEQQAKGYAMQMHSNPQAPRPSWQRLKDQARIMTTPNHQERPTARQALAWMEGVIPLPTPASQLRENYGFIREQIGDPNSMIYTRWPTVAQRSIPDVFKGHNQSDGTFTWMVSINGIAEKTGIAFNKLETYLNFLPAEDRGVTIEQTNDTLLLPAVARQMLRDFNQDVTARQLQQLDGWFQGVHLAEHHIGRLDDSRKKWSELQIVPNDAPAGQVGTIKVAARRPSTSRITPDQIAIAASQPDGGATLKRGSNKLSKMCAVED